MGNFPNSKPPTGTRYPTGQGVLCKDLGSLTDCFSMQPDNVHVSVFSRSGKGVHVLHMTGSSSYAFLLGFFLQVIAPTVTYIREAIKTNQLIKIFQLVLKDHYSCMHGI